MPVDGGKLGVSDHKGPIMITPEARVDGSTLPESVQSLARIDDVNPNPRSSLGDGGLSAG